MNVCLRHRCALGGWRLLAFTALIAGCGQPVREDRSINWSSEGQSVGFQHGQELSLWVTFMPAYRSVVSHLFGWGLRPGDPAAVFDLKMGQLGWMPVNAQEKVQVGHYYLLKRDYAQALRWYQEAERELPPPAPVVVRDFMRLS